MYVTGSLLPNDIYKLGRKVTNDPVFVGRAYHEGSLTPGEVDLEGVLKIPFGGEQIEIQGEFEVLVEEGSDWKKKEATEKRRREELAEKQGITKKSDYW